MAAENEAGFQSLFEEVVKAKRLSGSKVQKLQSIALKNMENDTQMVSIMYRTHKGLSLSQKVSSLYVFDALARAARDAIDKKKVSADSTSATGNCATFLLKLEGILESFVQDLLATKSSDLKEKTKKILDIWTKRRTFPAPLLERLSLVSGGSEKDSTRATGAVTQSTTPPGSPPRRAQPAASTEAVADVQNALLALLSQAASNPSQTAQTHNNAHPTQGKPDANQLAILQALAQASQTPVTNGNAQNTATAHPANSVPPRTEPLTGPTSGPSRRNNWDDRAHEQHAGPSRGGQPWRGRGRGGFRGSRDSPPFRTRRSRSRSPPYRRDARSPAQPYPPRRYDSRQQHQESKDEFGRDLKPGTPNRSEPPKLPKPPINVQPIPTYQERTVNNSPPGAPRPPQLNQTTHAPLKIIGAPIPSVLNQGLDGFDMSKFDFSSPESWQRLGLAWQQTHGHAPNQDQLMAYVMSGGSVRLPVNASTDGGGNTNFHGGGRGGGNNTYQGGGGGRNVGYVKNEDRQMNSWEQRGYNSTQTASDAVILGGGENAGNDDGASYTQYTDYSQHVSGLSHNQQEMGNGDFDDEGQSANASSGGKMQRVGDGWVWQPAS